MARQDQKKWYIGTRSTDDLRRLIARNLFKNATLRAQKLKESFKNASLDRATSVRDPTIRYNAIIKMNRKTVSMVALINNPSAETIQDTGTGSPSTETLEPRNLAPEFSLEKDNYGLTLMHKNE